MLFIYLFYSCTYFFFFLFQLNIFLDANGVSEIERYVSTIGWPYEINDDEGELRLIMYDMTIWHEYICMKESSK